MRGRTPASRRDGSAGYRRFLWLGWCALAVLACGGISPSAEPAPPVGRGFPLAAEIDPEGRAWVERTLEEMTLRQQVGQLVFPWISGAYTSPTSPEFADLMADVEAGVGGVLVSIGLPHSFAAKLNELQRRAVVPLLVTSDFENGGPGMRLSHIYAIPSLLDQGGGTSFPPTMALGAIGEERIAREFGRITAVEARAVGVHLNFAPVLDVNSNPGNPVINTRSFGEDPMDVARLGAAFIRGSREGGAMTTAKHFPGHGDTGIDSHIALPSVAADRARLDTLEFVPFRRAIDVGVDAVMTAHVVMPGLLGGGAPPATLSPRILEGVLRRDLGFDGLIFTDALSMGAITGGWGPGEAAVLALEAGSDVLLSPDDVGSTLDAVVEAVESGRLTRERIRASARRILELKARAGLHEEREVDLEAVDEIVGSGSHLAFADTVATRAITLVRDRNRLVPLEGSRILSLTWTRPGDALGSRTADALLRERFPEVRTFQLDESRSLGALDALWNEAWLADRVLVNAFIAYQAGTGTIGIPGSFARFVRRLAIHRPTVLASFGNPYLLEGLPEVGTYMVAWGGRDVSQAAAVRALAGESAITGTLPISIPPLHRRGDGLHRAAHPAVPGEGLDPASGGAPGAQDPPEARGAGARPDGPGPAGAGADRRRPDSLMAMFRSEAEVDPDEVGMSETSLAQLDSAVLEAIADSATPGAALVVGRGDRLVRLRGYGRTDWRAGAPPATPTTLYDLASLTKVVGTTTAIMRLVDEGRLSLDDRIIEYLPWWSAGDPWKEAVTVEHLLLHRSGLPPYRQFFLDNSGRADFERAVGAVPLEFMPGSRYQYSDIGMMTLGFVAEAVTNRPLDRYLDETVWTPLGMTDTDFLPDSTLLPRVAPTEVDTLFRGVHVHGAVHDENAYAMGGLAGHAGLFSTAADLAVFAATMLDGGELDPCGSEAGTTGTSIPCTVPWAQGGRIVSEDVVGDFTRRWDDMSSRTLGWDTPSGRSSAGDYFTAGAFGHTGFTGTSIWIDPELDLFVVLLTNRLNPTRENDRHIELRRTVHDLAALAVTDRPVELRP